jgi:hypothetical protein
MTEETKVLPSDDKRKGTFEPVPEAERMAETEKIKTAVEGVLTDHGRSGKVQHALVPDMPTMLRGLVLDFEMRVKHDPDAYGKIDSKKFGGKQLEFFLGANSALEVISGGKISLPAMLLLVLSIGQRAKDVLHITDAEVDEAYAATRKAADDDPK